MDHKAYWEDRLGDEPDLRDVGHRGLGQVFNGWMYRVRRVALQRALRRARIDLHGASVLEVGVGSGFWIPLWKEEGAARLVGVDITSAAVRALRRRYPDCEFVEADAGALDALPVAGGFDVATLFDVLFHITDDGNFRRAIRNAADCLRPGGYLLVTDGFWPGPEGTCRAVHELHRTAQEYQAAFDAAGLQKVHNQPIFFLMETPLWSGNDPLRAAFRKVVRGLQFGVLKVASRERTEALNHVPGAALALADVLLGAAVPVSPSLNLMVLRKVSAG